MNHLHIPVYSLEKFVDLRCLVCDGKLYRFGASFVFFCPIKISNKSYFYSPQMWINSHYLIEYCIDNYNRTYQQVYETLYIGDNLRCLADYSQKKISVTDPEESFLLNYDPTKDDVAEICKNIAIL